MVRPHTRVNQTTRRKIEEAIERLLAVLDAIDGDPEAEPDAEDEPSLGWSATGATSVYDTAVWTTDMEDEHDGREPEEEI